MSDTAYMEESSHYVKRVVLPSGKTIEVVYFKDAAEAPEGTTGWSPAVESDQELHVCVECASELVYPTGWEESGSGAWRVVLRCPECESLREGVFAQSTVDAFDERLDNGTDALMSDLRRLTRANMADEAERLAEALRVDAVLPEDF